MNIVMFICVVTSLHKVTYAHQEYTNRKIWLKTKQKSCSLQKKIKCFKNGTIDLIVLLGALFYCFKLLLFGFEK